MKTFWAKKKFLIILSAYILGAGLLLRFAAKPYISALKNQADKIQEKTIDNQVQSARVKEIPRMEQIYKRYQQDENFVDVILDPNEQLSFIKSLEKLAEDTGNKISLKAEESKSAPSAAKKTKSDSKSNGKEEKDILENLPYDRYFILEVSLEGEYDGLVNFIHKLENFNYYANVISIDVKKITQLPEKEAAQQPDQAKDSRNIFLSPDSKPAEPEKEEKKVLSSTIKVAVYTKK